MQQAGYATATSPDTFPAARLMAPGGDRRKAEHAYRELLDALPDNTAALKGLAHLLSLQGRNDAAAPYRRRLWQLHVHALGVPDVAEAGAAEFLLAAETGGTPPERAPAAYVEGLFDSYAATFDEHLLGQLHYAVPQLLARRFIALGLPSDDRLDILDIGCGSGLAGVQFERHARRLDGVDLSQNMLDLARGRGIYDGLYKAELIEHLCQCDRRYDLVVAADVLAYFGDVQPLMDAVHKVVADDGHFLFTVEKSDEADFRLSASGRYRHAARYLVRCADVAGFACKVCDEAVLREQHGMPVSGYVVVLHQP